MVEYFALLVLSFRYFQHSFFREPFSKVILLAAAFSLMYGATDELHQFFVPLRGAKLTDVGIDGIGILLASATLFFLQKNKNRS